MNTRHILLLAAILVSATEAQVSVTRSIQLPLPQTRKWANPQFSPTGLSVFYTDADGNGIWQYVFKTRTIRQITSDRKSVTAFSVSPDCKTVVYRRTTKEGLERKQDVVLVNILQKSSTVLASGSDVAIPSFAGDTPIYTVNATTQGFPSTRATPTTVLGIEDTKIALTLGGKKVLLDPIGNGRYIWPVLSPDKKRLVAYQMEKGAFICNVDGSDVTMIGKRDAPSWTRSGKWIVFMDAKDDGHKILSSDIAVVSLDGLMTFPLTTTSHILEMNPVCSPTEDKIACSTVDGSILILEYEER